MPKLKWGLSGDPGDIEGRNVYDGPTPPKGVFICALVRLGVKENRNGDNMFNGLLEIRDPRSGKKKFNGYSFWFNRNVTEQGAQHVKNFITKGLGVPMKDLAALDNLVVLEEKDLPSQVVSIGKVKIASEPLMVVVVRRRRDTDDPELETDDFAPAFPGIDPKKLATESAASDDDEDEDEDSDEDDDDMFDSDEDEDEDDTDDDDEEEEEDDGDDGDDTEDELTREELQAMGLAELRELAQEEPHNISKVRAGKLNKAKLVDLLAPAEDDDEDEDEEEDEEEPPPPPRKRTPAKRTARK